MSTFTLTQIDDDGGAAVTHVLHRINAGAAVATPIAVLPQTVDIAAQAGDEVQIALRNAIGDGPWSAALALDAPVSTISVPLSLTSGVTSISFDLDTIQPPASGTWEHSLLAPGPGQTLVDPTFTLSGIGTNIVTGDYIVRRTPDTGNLANIVFDVTVVEPSLTAADQGGGLMKATLVVGDDDPASTNYVIPVTNPGGPFDGLTATINRGAFNAIQPLPGEEPSEVLFVISGLIGIAVDNDSDGQIEAGDVVEVLHPPLPVQWPGPAVTVTEEWRLDGAPLALTNGLIPSGISGSLVRAWTAGSTTELSNPLVIPVPAPAPTLAYLGGSAPFAGQAQLSRTFADISNTGRLAGQKLLVGLMMNDNVYSNLTLNAVSVGAPAFFDNYISGSDRFSASFWLIDAPDADTLSFVATPSDSLDIAGSRNQIAVWEVYNGSIISSGGARGSAANVMSVPLSVPAGGAVAALAATGSSFGLTPMVNADPDLAAEAGSVSGQFMSIAASRSGLAATTPYTVSTFAGSETNGNRRSLLAAVSIG